MEMNCKQSSVLPFWRFFIPLAAHRRIGWWNLGERVEKHFQKLMRRFDFAFARRISKAPAERFHVDEGQAMGTFCGENQVAVVRQRVIMRSVAFVVKLVESPQKLATLAR